MKGWVGLLGWPVADGLPTLVVTRQLQVERRTGKVRQSETDVLPLRYATNHIRCYTLPINYRPGSTPTWQLLHISCVWQLHELQRAKQRLLCRNTMAPAFVPDADTSTSLTNPLLCRRRRGHFVIARSVRLYVPRRSCLGYRHAGCLQLSRRRPP